MLFRTVLNPRRWRVLKQVTTNFENISFANVNFELFDIALRTRKQPDSGDNVTFVIFLCMELM